MGALNRSRMYPISRLNGVATTQTSAGGGAKTKNGMGVAEGPNGTTCAKGMNNQGCKKQ